MRLLGCLNDTEIQTLKNGFVLRIPFFSEQNEVEISISTL